jgi:hypothetical protein
VLPLAATQKNTKWNPIVGVFAIIVGILWITAFVKTPAPKPSTSQLSRAGLESAPPVFTPNPAATMALTSAQHLAEACRALGKDSSNKKITPTQIAAARWHLETISKEAGESKDLFLYKP